MHQVTVHHHHTHHIIPPTRLMIISSRSSFIVPILLPRVSTSGPCQRRRRRDSKTEATSDQPTTIYLLLYLPTLSLSLPFHPVQASWVKGTYTRVSATITSPYLTLGPITISSSPPPVSIDQPDDVFASNTISSFIIPIRPSTSNLIDLIDPR